jgi:hypothetical protein
LLLAERSSHDFCLALVKKMPFPFYNREFVGRQLSFSESGCLIAVAHPEPAETKVDYGSKLRTVRATAMSVVRFEPVGDAQCKVTLIQHIDAGGIVPERVTTSKISAGLRSMCNLQDVFERDDEIDGAERFAMEQVIKMQLDSLGEGRGGVGGGDELDEELVPRVTAKFDALKGVDYRELEHHDYRVELKKYAVHNDDDIVGKFVSDAADSSSARTGTAMTLSSTSTPASRRKRDDGELVVGSASAVVDASIERCAAWAFAEAARLRTKDGDGSHRIRCDERPEDSQSQLVDTAYKLPGGKLLTCT